jgi:hypothetical protein
MKWYRRSITDRSMIRAHASTLITGPADRVFKLLAVDFFRSYKRWSPEVVSVQPLSEGFVRIGTTGRQVRIDHVRRTEATFRVSAFESGKRIDFQGISDPFHISYRLQGLAEQTRLTFDFELSRLPLYMRPFETLIRIVAQDDAERVVRNIKRLVEADGARRAEDVARRASYGVRRRREPGE